MANNVSALNLDGNDYAETPHHADLEITSSWTTECWVYTPTGYNVPDAVICGKSQNDYGNSNLVLSLGYNTFAVGFQNSYTGYQASYNAANVGQGWRHWAGVFDDTANTITLYLDGRQVAQTTGVTAVPGASGHPFTVGRRYAGTLYFAGQVDELRVWNVARSAAQILAYKHIKAVGTETGLVACYHFDENTGTTANDAAGTAQNLTLTGATWATTPLPPIRAGADTEPTYQAAVLADTPRGYWRLGEPSGTSAADLSGNAINGTYTGSVTLAAAGALASSSDTAITLPGTPGNYVTLPTNALLDIGSGGNPLTLECWFKTTTNNDHMELIGGYNSSNPYSGYGLRLNYGQPSIWNGTNWYTLSQPHNDGNWHHIVVTSSGSTITFYVDGAYRGVTTANQPGSYSGGRALGLRSDGAYGTWAGQLDECAIYASALSVDRVIAHYLAAIAPPPPPPETLPGVPSADITVGGWTTDTGATTNLYQAIDEAPASDADYIRSEVAPVASVYEVALGAAVDPAQSNQHDVQLRTLLDVTGPAHTLNVELRQGASALSTPATWLETPSTTLQQFTHTLTAGQTDAITDYTNLRLRLTASQAAPTWVTSGVLTVTASNGATFTPNLPASAEGQDILVLMLFRNDNSAPTAPSGWTLVNASLNGVNSSTTIQSVYWYWRLAAGTAGVTTTTTAPVVTYGTSTILRGGRMFVIRGADTTAPFATVSGGGGAYTRLNNAHQAAGAASATNTTDLTPVESNTIGVVFAVSYGQRAGTAAISGATGWFAPNTLSTTTGTDATTSVSWKQFSAPSLLDNPTIDQPTTTTAGVSTGFLFAFKPPASTSRVRVTWAKLTVPVAPLVVSPSPVSSAAAAAAPAVVRGPVVVAAPVVGAAATTTAPLVEGGLNGFAAYTLSLGPGLYWRLGEAASATTATDLSGNGRNGTYNDFAATRAAITYGVTSGLTGDSDTAVRFSENDGWVEVVNGSAAIASVPEVTLMAMVNIPSGTHDYKGIAGVRGWTGTADRGFWLQRSTGNTVEAHYAGDTGSPNYGTTFTLTTGVWHLVVATYRASDGEILVYVDGLPVALNVNTTGGQFAQSNLPFQVGRLNYQHNGAGSAWNHAGQAAVDEVALFPKALTGRQVADLWDRVDQTFREEITLPYLLANRWIAVNTSGNALDVGTNTGIDIFNATKAERPIHCYNVFCDWGSGASAAFPAHECDNIYARNAVPMITWEPTLAGGGVTQPAYQLSDILAGTYNSYIDTWAARAAAYGEIILLRFAQEMNGANWFSWQEGYNGNTAGQFVSVWQYVHARVAAAGATNVRWVWSPNVDHNNPSSGWTAMSAVYPGASYVDWVGLDGFNRGTVDDVWQTPNALFKASYDRITALAPGKPVLIGEVSSAEAGGSKAAWITDLFTDTIPSDMPLVLGVAWIDNIIDIDWRVDSSATSQDAYALAVDETSNYYSFAPPTVDLPYVDEFTGAPDADATITDTASIIDMVGNRLFFSNGGANNWTDHHYTIGPFSRSTLGAWAALIRVTNYTTTNGGLLVSVGPSASDPAAAGSGTVNTSNQGTGNYQLWSLGQRVDGGHTTTSIDYLFGVAPRAGGGWFTFASGGRYGAFPAATMLGVSDTQADATLYAHIAAKQAAFYTDYVKALPISDLPTAMQSRYGLALAADTFDRGSLGTTAEFGGQTYTVIGSPSISSNRLTASNYEGIAVNPGVRSRVIKARLVTGSGAGEISLIFRGDGTQGSGISFYLSGSLCGLYRQSDGNPFDQTGAYHLDASTTHELEVRDTGTSIEALLDGQTVAQATTTLDNTQTSVGFYLVPDCTVDQFSLWPEAITLTGAFGTFPAVPVGQGAALAGDAFTNIDGTALTTHNAAWVTTGTGSWEVRSGEARMTSPGVSGIAHWDTGTVDHEASSVLRNPTTTPAYPNDWFNAVYARFVDGSHYIEARKLRQDASNEIEVWEDTGSGKQLIGYVNLGDYYTPGGTNLVKLAVKGAEAAAYLDGEVVVQCTVTGTSGTRVGIGVNDSLPNGQPSWDDFEIRTAGVAPLLVSPAPVSSAAAVIVPTVVRGPIALTPAAVESKVDSQGGIVVRGSLTLTSAPASAPTALVAPTVVRGSVSTTVSPAAAASSLVAPTTVRGSVVYAVTPVVSPAAVVAPSVVRGGIISTPAPAAAPTGVVAPAVSIVTPVSYTTAVLVDLPLGYWKLGESAGTVAADSSGHSAAGTYVGAPTLGQPGGVTGDTAAAFNGSSQWVTIASNSWLNTHAGAFTVEAWIKTDGVVNDDGCIYDSMETTAGTGGFRFELLNGKLYATIGRPGYFTTSVVGNEVAFGGTILEDNEWHHVAATYDGVNEFLLYIDGRGDGGVEVGVYNTTAWSGNRYIGHQNEYPTTYNFAGLIDEVAVYGTALSPQRIADHYGASGGPVIIIPYAVSARAQRVAPIVTIASPPLLPVPAAAAAALVAPTVVRGPLSITPALVGGAAATVAPSVVRETITYAPASSVARAVGLDPTMGAVGGIGGGAISSVAAVVAPTVVRGSVVHAPALVSAATSRVAPTVLISTNPLTPLPAAAATALAPPLIVGGPVVLTPPTVTGSAALAGPTVVRGSVLVLPSNVSGSAARAGPTVVANALLLPSFVTGSAAVVAPAVVRESVVYAPPIAAGRAQLVAPAVVQSSVVYAPPPATAATARLQGLIDVGTLFVYNPQVLARAQLVAPSIFFGSVAYAPAGATTRVETLSASVRYGSITLSVAPVLARSVALPGTLQIGAIIAQPAPVAARGTLVLPTVRYGSVTALAGAVAASAHSVGAIATLGSIVVVPSAAVMGTQLGYVVIYQFLAGYMVVVETGPYLAVVESGPRMDADESAPLMAVVETHA